MAKISNSVDILVIGKTGNGKSAFCNSLLGRKEFKSGSQSTSVTDSIQVAWAERNDGTQLKVVDGPGVEDTNLTKLEDTENAINYMSQALTLCNGSVNAISVVLKYGNRYTKEEQATVQSLKIILGREFLSKSGIVVFTCGDNFETEMEDSDDPVDFETWCKRQVGPMKELMEECNFRCVLFNNRTKNQEEKQKQSAKFFDFTEKIKETSGNYTNKIFQGCAKERRQYITRLKAPILKESIQKKINLLSSELIFVSENESEAEIMKWIGKIDERIDGLLEEINKEDNDTGEFKELKDLLSKLKEKVMAVEVTIEASSKQQENERELKKGGGNECNSTDFIPSRQSCSRDRFLYFIKVSDQLEQRRTPRLFRGMSAGAALCLAGAASCHLGAAITVGSGGILTPVGAALIGGGAAAVATGASINAASSDSQVVITEKKMAALEM